MMWEKNIYITTHRSRILVLCQLFWSYVFDKVDYAQKTDKLIGKITSFFGENDQNGDLWKLHIIIADISHIQLNLLKMK